MFLDKESERILRACIDSESTYPAVLRDMFKDCDYAEETRLRSILHSLINNGYLSKIQWADNLPYRGRIEQKGQNYFHQKDVFIRRILREDSRFDLDDECENALIKLIEEFEKQATPYAVVDGSFYSAQILKLLNQRGLIEFNGKGIDYLMAGGFSCMYAITHTGKKYFEEKEKFIEEALLFQQTNVPNPPILTTGEHMVPTNIKKKYDVFISHANADKLTYVDELNDSLSKLKINIFYDKDALDWGDDWKGQILAGVEQSEFAIIVISKNFFHREWTERELNELLNRQNKSGERIILPILHQITFEQLQEKYPAIASIQALKSADYSCDEIALKFASKLIKKLKQSR